MFEGRIDSQIKIRGHRVDLTEVEKAVNSLEGVDKGIVLCYKPGDVNQALLAFVTASTAVKEKQVEDMLSASLPTYMVPQVILLEMLPLLINGKVDRNSLLLKYESINNFNDHQKFTVGINYDGVQEDKIDAAKALFETVASILGRSARSDISKDANFYEIGGNSLNSIITITALSERGYRVSIGDFISAKNFGELLSKMSAESLIADQPSRYTREMLKDEHKAIFSDIIATSFWEYSPVEVCLRPNLNVSHYLELFDGMWKALLDVNISFVVKDEKGNIVGAALNFDGRDKPDMRTTSTIRILLDFLETIERPIRESKIPTGKGKVLHCFLIAPHYSLSPKEKVAVIYFMETEIIKIATERKFVGIFATNTSPLTQQLATDVTGYETLLDYQINQYVAKDNTKPFGMAPDEVRAKIQWKLI